MGGRNRGELRSRTSRGRAVATLFVGATLVMALLVPGIAVTGGGAVAPYRAARRLGDEEDAALDVRNDDCVVRK
jgi:hypothetical protein